MTVKKCKECGHLAVDDPGLNLSLSDYVGSPLVGRDFDATELPEDVFPSGRYTVTFRTSSGAGATRLLHRILGGQFSVTVTLQ
jgi:hypothetical protein